jgi:hypothetical protein
MLVLAIVWFSLIRQVALGVKFCRLNHSVLCLSCARCHVACGACSCGYIAAVLPAVCTDCTHPHHVQLIALLLLWVPPRDCTAAVLAAACADCTHSLSCSAACSAVFVSAGCAAGVQVARVWPCAAALGQGRLAAARAVLRRSCRVPQDLV